jgi:hypothetical protein
MRTKATQNLKHASVYIGASLVFAFILFQLIGFVAFFLVWAGVFAYAVTTIALTIFMYWVGKSFSNKPKLSIQPLLLSISVGGLIVLAYALFAAVHTEEEAWLFILPSLCIMIAGALKGAYTTQKARGSHGA